MLTELCLDWTKTRTQSATLACRDVLPRRHWGPPTPSSTSSKWCLIRLVAVARSALGDVFPGCCWRPAAPLGASIWNCCRNFHDLLPGAAVAVWCIAWTRLASIGTNSHKPRYRLQMQSRHSLGNLARTASFQTARCCTSSDILLLPWSSDPSSPVSAPQ